MQVTPVSIRRKILTGDIRFTEKGRSSRKGERPFSIPNVRRQWVSYLCFRGIYSDEIQNLLHAAGKGAVYRENGEYYTVGPIPDFSIPD